jgi:hypothetical protein
MVIFLRSIQIHLIKQKGCFTPLEIMPRCSAAGLDFRIIPAGFNAPLEFLTGFTYFFLLLQPTIISHHRTTLSHFETFESMGMP